MEDKTNSFARNPRNDVSQRPNDDSANCAFVEMRLRGSV